MWNRERPSGPGGLGAVRLGARAGPRSVAGVRCAPSRSAARRAAVVGWGPLRGEAWCGCSGWVGVGHGGSRSRRRLDRLTYRCPCVSGRGGRCARVGSCVISRAHRARTVLRSGDGVRSGGRGAAVHAQGSRRTRVGSAGGGRRVGPPRSGTRTTGTSPDGPVTARGTGAAEQADRQKGARSCVRGGPAWYPTESPVGYRGAGREGGGRWCGAGGHGAGDM